MIVLMASRGEKSGANQRRQRMQAVNEIIGAELRDLRVQRNLTQGRIADLLGTTQQNVSRIEQGGSELKAVQLIQLVDVFGLSGVERLVRAAIGKGGLPRKH